ncbi:immunoglobulin-like domain-containing protein [Rhodohalobacter sp. 8-1]|uniref:immunoglobulin-like domain-containing protein n=1 Tax=Rhodohalobacter sp. 8-1 TaxID=3131972 RepID=UPI0030EB6FBB
MGDYTGDGALDLVVTGEDASRNPVGLVYRNDGAGGLVLDAAASAVVADVSNGSVAWGDYTGDGWLDLVVTGADAGTFSAVGLVYRNDGSGGLVLDATASATVADVWNGSVAWGDYTGDGGLDLVVTGDQNFLFGSLSQVGLVYRNDGSGGLALDPVASDRIPNAEGGTVAWGDFTGDGALDLIVSGFLGITPVTSVFKNVSNLPPVADAGPDGALITLDGSGSSDPDGDVLTYLWSEGGAEIATGSTPTVTLGLGTHTIMLTVTDPFGETSSDDVIVTVEDTTPPEIILAGDDPATVECGTAYADAGATAVDLVDGPVTVALDASAVDTDTPGTYTVTYEATDAAGNTATAERTVTVEDTTAPELTVSADPLVLTRPNHKYVTVSLADLGLTAADACDGTIEPGQVYVASVSSDEPENASDDGNTFDDIVVDDCRTVRVRAERDGMGNGRVYTITLAVADAAGNVGTAAYEVQVPLSSNGEAAVPDGAVYTVDGCDLSIPAVAPPAAALAPVGFGPETAPAEFALSAAYPNPFNPTTTISFDLPKASFVSLSVYSILGQQVAQLVNEQKSPGRYTVSFDASTLSSGIYLYRLQTDSFMETMQMTLVK